MIRAATITKHMIEKPYHLGLIKTEFDCLSYILYFYDSLGYKFPDIWWLQTSQNSWEGWTRENYARKWEQGEGRDAFIDFLTGLGREVQINYMLEGDLIILDVEETGYPCIYLGNAKVLIISVETGVTVMPLWAIKKRIIEVRRLIDG